MFVAKNKAIVSVKYRGDTTFADKIPKVGKSSMGKIEVTGSWNTSNTQ